MLKKQTTRKIVATVVLCSIAGFASAGQGRGNHDKWGGWHQSPPHSINAPEIDPASASSALTLLMGGLTLLRSRSRKNK